MPKVPIGLIWLTLTSISDKEIYNKTRCLRMASFPLPWSWAPWFYLVLTIGALVWLSWQYTLALASVRWPRVQGRVIKAWVEHHPWGDPPNHSPRVEYVYKVDGQHYSSRTIRLTGSITTGKGRAEKIIARYPVGSPVDVWYDPDKHERATLKPGGGGWLLGGIIVVGVMGPLLTFASTPAGRLFLRGLGIQEEP
jgi:Protein of unknown function (DUF3592)